MTLSRFARPIQRSRPIPPVGRRGYWVWLVVLAMAGWIAWLVFQNGFRNELAVRLQQKINQQLAGSLLNAKISKAEFIAGQGILLNDARLLLMDPVSTSGQTPVSFEVYEAFIKLPVSLPELLTHPVQPEAVRVRRAKIQLVQNESGDWNVPAFIEQLSQLNRTGSSRIPLTFTDCVIELISPNPQLMPVVFSDVRLDVTPILFEERPLIEVRGELNAPDVIEARFLVYIDEAGQTWQGHLEIVRFHVNPQILALLPTQWSEEFSRWPNIEGRLKGAATLRGDLTMNQPIEFDGAGRLTDFNCDDPHLPLPIQNARLNFQINNDLLQLTEATGLLGTSRFSVDASYQLNEPTPQWSAQGAINQFDFDQTNKLADWLPSIAWQIYQDYSPQGRADIEFDVQQTATGSSREINLAFTDMAFRLNVFPYPFKHCRGKL